MSVDIKTPTRTQFEHAEFPCGEIRQSPKTKLSVQSVDSKKEENVARENKPLSPAPMRKRRNDKPYHRSMSVSARILPIDDKPPPKRRKSSSSQRMEFKLPSKFLLGGNINDPLNLNSLCEDEEINRQLNAVTPQSSPIIRPSRVSVIIPPNIKDPLNLNAMDDEQDILISPKTKKKHKRNKFRKKSEKEDSEATLSADKTCELSIDVSEKSDSPVHRVDDRIVSPVVPQTSPKSKRGKRKSEDGKPEPSSAVARSFAFQSKTEKGSVPVKFSRQNSKHAGSACGKNKFVYGNYNRYYGYRNPDAEGDLRVTKFKSEWFEGRQVLDIGCNVGHVTLEIAKKFGPSKVVGLDVDKNLIAAAKKNVRHYVTSEKSSDNRFPTSMSLCYGPATAPPVSSGMFPNNVMFVQGNYVLETDELLALQKEEYDTILCLSVTKWMHLHHGDEGLKRVFKRMFRQLRPGGKLILEPQSWTSYKKKKKLTEEIFKVFSSIKFKPDQFTEFLLSLGFSTCENLDLPLNKSKGFRRPIQVYTKSDTAFPSPWMTPATASQISPGNT